MRASLKKKEGFQGQKAIVIPRKVLNNQVVENSIISLLFITDIGYYPMAKFHYRQRPHGTDQYILIHCVEGAGEVVIRKEKYTIRSGDFFVVPLHTAHTYAASEKTPWTIYWIHFKGSSAASLIELMARQFNGFKGFLKNGERAIALFDEIYSQLERGYSNDHLVYANLCLWHYLVSFIYGNNYGATGHTSHKDICDMAIDFMSKKVNQVLSVEEIAGSVNVSPSHFSFLFKKKTGFTPIEYFNQLKVQKACQYLLFTKLRIKEIALELGIEDQYYFSRMFSKVMGMSPNEYKEKRNH